MANTRVESTWQDALKANYGDYAYAPDGGMLSRQDDNTYRLQSGDLQRERTDLAEQDIPDALQALGISPDGWTYE